MNTDPLEPVAEFPYLGRTFVYNNIKWVTLYQNIWKAQWRWAMVEKVVKKTGETVWVRGMLHKAVMKLVLLYVGESWVVRGVILKLLEELHHRLARRIEGMTAQRTTIGEWE